MLTKKNGSFTLKLDINIVQNLASLQKDESSSCVEKRKENYVNGIFRKGNQWRQRWITIRLGNRTNIFNCQHIDNERTEDDSMSKTHYVYPLGIMKKNGGSKGCMNDQSSEEKPVDIDHISYHSRSGRKQKFRFGVSKYPLHANKRRNNGRNKGCVNDQSTEEKPVDMDHISNQTRLENILCMLTKGETMRIPMIQGKLYVDTTTSVKWNRNLSYCKGKEEKGRRIESFACK